MTTSAKAISETAPAIPPEFGILQTIAMLCGVGLLTSLVLISSGLLFVPTEPEALNVIAWV